MKHLLYPVLFGLGLAGCSQAAQEESAHLPQTTTDSATAPARTTANPAGEAAPSRSVIYTGQLSLAVENFEQASGQIDQVLLAHKAYVGTAHETRAQGRHRQEMTIKVPPAQFMPLLQALGKLGRVESKDVTSADVTADVLEASTGLATRREAENRYQQLLKQAKTPAEIQRLEEQTRQARIDIAAAEAQLKTWGSQSAWASLTLHFYQTIPAAETLIPEPAAAPRLLAAFNNGWSILVGLAVLLTNIWPLLLLGAAGAGLWRRWHHRQQTPA